MRRRGFLASVAAGVAAACTGPDRAALIRQWPPVGDFIEVDGKAVHYWAQGRGRPVVLIHGASGNLRDWTFGMAPQLAERYRVIAFDRPGFGYSERVAERGWHPAVQARHLRRAADALEIERPIVVGHSWGGALAMAWALDAPEQTGGVVTLGGATMPWGGDISFLYRLGASDVIGGLTSAVFSTLATEARIDSAIREIFAPQPVPQGYTSYVGAQLAAQPRVFRYNSKDVANLDSVLGEQSGRYGDLAVPVEILHGTADTIVWSSVHAEVMHDRLPHSRLTLLDGVGHMPHHARPDALAAALARLT